MAEKKLNMFEDFFNNTNSWLNDKGPDSNIVISSRIRLARNINNFLFTSQATIVQKNKILDKIFKSCLNVSGFKESFCDGMEKIDELNRQFLLERHLISREHLNNPEGKGVCVSKDERISLMINEEDHLRLQVIVSGFDLDNAWNIINKVDDELSENLEFSFSPDFGYLTSCPTNVGTGLRASCMLHLPALILTKRINKILELLTKLSFTTRGLFGEGTQALGDFFQVSNQVSLGVCEKEIIENLIGAVKQVKEQELLSRDILVNKNKNVLQDNIWRSFGVLTNCRLISTKEALSHLSMLCIGVDLGIIKGIKRNLVNSLFILVQPAHLQKIEGKILKESQRDHARAEVLREKLQF